MTHIDTIHGEEEQPGSGAMATGSTTPSPSLSASQDMDSQMASNQLPQRRHSSGGRSYKLKLNPQLPTTSQTPPTTYNINNNDIPSPCDLSPPTPTHSREPRRKSFTRSDALETWPEFSPRCMTDETCHLPEHKTSIVTLPDQTKLVHHHNHNNLESKPPLPPIIASSVPHLPSQAPAPSTCDNFMRQDQVDHLRPPDAIPIANQVPTISLASPPPDGGWGWVVVFASFMIHVIADGITYSFGIFHKELLRDFKASNAMTSWVASIMTGVTFCIGPIASGLTNRYGCRAVTIAGAILCSLGLACSTMANSIQMLFLTIGAMAGAGFGLMYLPAIVSVTCYFERHRATATGIAVCGSGIGSAIFAPIIEYLILEYGWRGAMLIVSAIVLNCCALGALFRPLKEEVIIITPAGSRRVTEEHVKLLNQLHESGFKPPLEQLEEEYEDDNVPELDEIWSERHNKPRPSLARTTSSPPGSNLPSPTRHQSIHHHVRLLVTDNNHDLETNYLDPHHAIHAQSVLERGAHSMDEPHGPNPLMVAAMAGQGHAPIIMAGGRRKSITISPGILSRKDIFYSGSLVNIPQYRSNPKLYSVSMTSLGSSFEKHNGRQSVSTAFGNIITTDQGHFELVKSPSNHSQITSHAKTSMLDRVIRKWFKCSNEMYEAVAAMTDLSILRDLIFVVFAISNFLTSIGFFVPNLFVADRVLKLGLADSDQASYLLAAMGIGSSTGRLIFGSLSDRKWVNRLWLYAGSLTLCGVATVLSVCPPAQSYAAMFAYCLTFGLSCGTFVSLTSVLLVDLLGLEKLTNSFGLLLLFQGVASLIGPPIIGYLYDFTGSYDHGFMLAGSLIALSGLILIPIPRLQKLLAQRQRISLDYKL